VLIDWTDEFNTWLDRLDVAAQDDPISARRRDYIDAQLTRLQELTEAPTDDTATLKRVRQSRNNLVWRLSHPYDPDIAVRLIVWFPDDNHAVIALFATDKARMGDVFYNSVGTRADAVIDKWSKEDRS